MGKDWIEPEILPPKILPGSFGDREVEFEDGETVCFGEHCAIQGVNTCGIDTEGCRKAKRCEMCLIAGYCPDECIEVKECFEKCDQTVDTLSCSSPSDIAVCKNYMECTAVCDVCEPDESYCPITNKCSKSCFEEKQKVCEHDEVYCPVFQECIPMGLTDSVCLSEDYHRFGEMQCSSSEVYCPETDSCEKCSFDEDANQYGGTTDGLDCQKDPSECQDRGTSTTQCEDSQIYCPGSKMCLNAGCDGSLSGEDCQMKIPACDDVSVEFICRDNEVYLAEYMKCERLQELGGDEMQCPVNTIFCPITRECVIIPEGLKRLIPGEGRISPALDRIFIPFDRPIKCKDCIVGDVFIAEDAAKLGHETKATVIKGKVLEISLTKDTTWKVNEELTFARGNMVSPKGCGFSGGTDPIGSISFEGADDVQPSVQLAGQRVVCGSGIKTWGADRLAKHGGHPMTYHWEMQTTNNTDLEHPKMAELKELVAENTEPSIGINIDMIPDEFKLGVRVVNYMGAESDISYKTIEISSDSSIEIDANPRRNVKPGKPYTVGAKFINCNEQKLPGVIKCLWEIQPEIEFIFTEDCNQKFPRNSLTEKTNYTISVAGTVNNKVVAKGQMGFETGEEQIFLQKLGSDVVYASVDDASTFKFRSSFDAAKDDKFFCNCKDNSDGLSCDKNVVEDSSDLGSPLESSVFKLQVTSPGNYTIICTYARGSRIQESNTSLVVVNTPVPRITLKVDDKSIPPGESVIFMVTSNFSRNTNAIPITASIGNCQELAEGITEFPLDRLPESQIINVANEKSQVAFTLTDLEPDATYCFKIDMADRNNKILNYVEKSLFVPPSMKGGVLEIIPKNESCLVDVNIEKVVSVIPDLVYQLTAGNNYVHEPTGSHMKNVVLPKEGFITVKITNIFDDQIKLRHKTIDACVKFTEADRKAVEGDCLAGNIKGCRANLINMLSIDNSIKNIELAADMMEELKHSVDKTNADDLRVMVLLMKRSNIRRKKRETEENPINSTAQMKTILSDYILDRATNVEKLRNGFTEFVSSQCPRLTDIGSRPIITKDNHETNIQVLDSYLHVYVHRTKLGNAVTDNKDGIIVNWQEDDEFYSEWDCTSSDTCIGVCVGIVTFSKDITEDFYEVADGPPLASLTTFLKLFNPLEPEAIPAYTPKHVMTLQHFDDVVTADVKCASAYENGNSVEDTIKTQLISSETCQRCFSCELNTPGYAYGQIRPDPVTTPSTTLTDNNSSESVTEDSSGSTAGINGSSTGGGSSTGSSGSSTSDGSSAGGTSTGSGSSSGGSSTGSGSSAGGSSTGSGSSAGGSSTGSDSSAGGSTSSGGGSDTTGSGSSSGGNNGNLSGPFKRNEYLILLTAVFSELTDAGREYLSQQLSDLYKTINGNIKITVLALYPGSVIINYEAEADNLNDVDSAVDSFTNGLESGDTTFFMNGESHKASKLNLDEGEHKHPFKRREHKWMSSIMGIVIGVFFLMVILVVMTACVVRILYKGRSRVGDCPENPQVGQDGVTIPRGVAVFVPFGKTPYESGLSTVNEAVAVDSIPEPAKYDLPAPIDIQNTPRLPTAVRGNLKHRENSALNKDSDDEADMSDNSELKLDAAMNSLKPPTL